MNSKLSLLSRATAIAGIVALALPAFAQTNPPAVAPSAPATQGAPVAKTTGTVQSTAKKTKTHAAKKHDGMVKTAKSDTGHKPAPVKPEAAPAPVGGNAGK